LLLFSDPPAPIATVASFLGCKGKRQAEGVNAVVFHALDGAGPCAYGAFYNDVW